MGLPPRAAALDEFFAELDQLGREIRADVSAADLKHLKRIERFGRACSATGWATSWMGPNLVSAGMMSLGRTTRWATVAHHVCHDGYKRVPGIPERYTRRGFGRGWRRFIDWFDVIRPEGWHAEHNILHHTRLGEAIDPDLVQQNLDWLRQSDMPAASKYALVFAMASAWKWIYYAPNTLQEAYAAADKDDERLSLRDLRVWGLHTQKGRDLWARSFGPYAAWHFLAAPMLFMPLGPLAAASSATNSLIAEWLTNLHTFVIITTNHAGDDVYMFEGEPANAHDFQLRQILGSVNYATGGDANDVMHGWLNYQIEHHVWPDLTMLQYRKVQPKLKALCEKHGVPYVQESIGKRLKKTLDIMVGHTDMAEI